MLGRCGCTLPRNQSPVVMGVGQERRVLLVALSVCERGHLPSAVVVIMETGRHVLIKQCRMVMVVNHARAVFYLKRLSSRGRRFACGRVAGGDCQRRVVVVKSAVARMQRQPVLDLRSSEGVAIALFRDDVPIARSYRVVTRNSADLDRHFVVGIIGRNADRQRNRTSPATESERPVIVSVGGSRL
jgi:hypothetical protein